jgi:hypothetical protein
MLLCRRASADRLKCPYCRLCSNNFDPPQWADFNGCTRTYTLAAGCAVSGGGLGFTSYRVRRSRYASQFGVRILRVPISGSCAGSVGTVVGSRANAGSAIGTEIPVGRIK